MTLPLLIGGVCILTSIIGTYMVKLGAKGSIMGALYKGFWTATILGGIAIAGAAYVTFGGDLKQVITTTAGLSFPAINLVWTSFVGLAVTALIVWITEYYTGTHYRPVQSIARASQTGHGTNVIQGLAISLESTALPTLVIVVGVIVSWQLAGPLGVAFAASAMLALAGMVVALDAYGPVTDNAGGIAEMAGMEDEVRTRTDALDAVGNTTKAVTKGYAIGSAGLAALVLFGAYTADLKEFGSEIGVTSNLDTLFSLSNPYVIVGLLLGALLPYLFGAMGLTAVGRAGGAVVEEVRAQFRDNPGIMDGSVRPELRPHRRPRHQGGDPRDDPAVAAAGAGPDRGLLRHRRGRRARECAGVGRRVALGRDRLRPVRRHFDDQRRRRLGQCQEVYRGRPLRRQGLRGAQGRGDRRHGRRSLQGHRRPGGQPDDQDHQHRRAAAARGAGRRARPRTGRCRTRSSSTKPEGPRSSSGRRSRSVSPAPARPASASTRRA